jgi:hypothetical protein
MVQGQVEHVGDVGHGDHAWESEEKGGRAA